MTHSLTCPTHFPMIWIHRLLQATMPSLSPLVFCPTPWSRWRPLGLSIQHQSLDDTIPNKFVFRACSRNNLSSQQRSFPSQHGRVLPSRHTPPITRTVAAQAESPTQISQNQQERRSSQDGITSVLPIEDSATFLADRASSTVNTGAHVFVIVVGLSRALFFQTHPRSQQGTNLLPQLSSTLPCPLIRSVIPGKGLLVLLQFLPQLGFGEIQ